MTRWCDSEVKDGDYLLDTSASALILSLPRNCYKYLIYQENMMDLNLPRKKYIF